MAHLDTLCVYCGSSPGAAQAYGAVARELGRRCAENGVGVVYGGGTVGLMGQVAEAADERGRSRDRDHPAPPDAPGGRRQADSQLVVVDSMHERKQAMFERSDAFCSLPGGIGTLDETIEILTWKQLGLHDKPVVLIDHDGFWQPLFDLFAHQQAAGFLKPDHVELFEVVPDIDRLFRAIAAHPEPTRADRPDWT